MTYRYLKMLRSMKSGLANRLLCTTKRKTSSRELRRITFLASLTSTRALSAVKKKATYRVIRSRSDQLVALDIAWPRRSPLRHYIRRLSRRPKPTNRFYSRMSIRINYPKRRKCMPSFHITRMWAPNTNRCLISNGTTLISRQTRRLWVEMCR